MNSLPAPKTPRTPPAQLIRERRDVVTHTDIIWRIHRTRGEHVLPWNQLRTFGPLPSMRWDQHPVPGPGPSAVGILYGASDVGTAVAEVFQTTRIVDTVTGAPTLTGWRPTRPLGLLDLSDTWSLRNGASAALSTAPRPVCRRWARAISVAWPDLDGLRVPSTMTGRPNIVLWSSAADAMPELPLFSRPLDHPLVWSIVQAAASEIGYRTC